MPIQKNPDEEILNIPLINDDDTGNQEYSEPTATEDSNEEEKKRMLLGDIPQTVHRISQDSWFQVCIVLTTSINSAFILSFTGTIMVYLGWIPGVAGFIIANAISLYANSLPVKLHELGGKRHIRYRDLAGHIYGKQGYYIIWILQYLSLYMVNIGGVIMAGSAIQAVYTLFGNGNALKLSYCSLIAGFLCFMFAMMVPHLSALGIWLGLASIPTVIYIVVALVISIRDGERASGRDYSIPGTSTAKIFTTIGAIASLFVTTNTGMIPEIQATIRAPVVSNMMKALYVQFTIGVLPMLAVIFVGYWAYGSSASSYLLDNASGPAWAKAVANVAVFLQLVIIFHVFACPSYEYFDSKFGVKGNATAIRNLTLRIGIRGSYLLACSMVAAALPFIADFIGLIASICSIPLTFVIPHHMYLVAMKSKLNSLQKLWHWLNVIIFTVLSVAGTVASVRLIVVNMKNYEIFGD